MKTDGTKRYPAVLYAKANGDEATFNRLAAEWERGQQAFLDAIAEVRADPEPEPKPSLRVVQSHPSMPDFRPATTRGPWVLSIEGLGRPLTFNAERTSSMSKATMVKVREAERSWKEAVSREATRAGMPMLARAYVVIQPYYSDRRVPDVDGSPSSVKASLDGLVHAGVLPDDRRDQVCHGYHVLPPITDGGPERLTVTVYPLP